jgi:hypothetical protein
MSCTTYLKLRGRRTPLFTVQQMKILSMLAEFVQKVGVTVRDEYVISDIGKKNEVPVGYNLVFQTVI